jgi:hypothetical protein
MKSLDEIGIAHQTDKASQFSRTYAQPHNYLVHLERFFEPMRDKPIKLLEIGVGGGESIKTWFEYFEQARIYGVDIVSNTNDWNVPGISRLRYFFSCGDQSKPEFWKKFIEVYGGDWDVVIDDGSHLSKDSAITFGALFPALKSGGIYEIEDLSFDAGTLRWLETFVRGLHVGHDYIDSIYFARELCVIRKK